MDSMYDVLLQLPIFQGVSRNKISELIEKMKFHFLQISRRRKNRHERGRMQSFEISHLGRNSLRTDYTKRENENYRADTSS